LLPAENRKFSQHQSSLFVIFQPSERKKNLQSCASNKLHSKILNKLLSKKKFFNKLPLSYRKKTMLCAADIAMQQHIDGDNH
jgi:hypothetical protein